MQKKKKMVDYAKVGNLLIDHRCSPVAATEEILSTTMTRTCLMGWEGPADWRTKMEVAEARSLLTAAEATMTMTCLEVVKSWNCHRCFEKIRKVELVVVKTLNCRRSKMEKAAGLVIVLTMAEAMNLMESFLRVKEG
jgi:hypothetical protein